jgi:RNA polymerase sigma-70 factor (ECF subfamily)
MQSRSMNPGVQDLLAHADWLKGLASRLVSGSDADDLVQETWLAALRSPPEGEAGEAQPWLGRVLRNLAVSRYRARRVRERAEPAVVQDAAPQAPLSPETLAERAAVQRALSELVSGLDESIRTVLLLRYYEGKSGAEIARALGVPAGTVRWRLHEGIRQLRSQLDQRYDGDRDRWRALLAPLGAGVAVGRTQRPREGVPAAPITPPGTRLVPATTVGRLLVLVAVGGVLLVGARLMVSRSASPPPDPSVAGSPGGTFATRSPRAASFLPVDSDEPSGTLTGRVLDQQGQPVPGARVAALLETETGREAADQAYRLRAAAVALTAEGGWYRLGPLPPGTYALGATAPRARAGVRTQLLLMPDEQLGGIDIQLGREGLAIHGRVLDAGSGPIPASRIQAVSLPVEGETPQLFEVLSDQDGAFSFILPRANYTMVARAAGYASGIDSVTQVSSRSLEFRLSPAGQIRGRVVDPATGAGQAGATVSAWPWTGSNDEPIEVAADADGLFQIADLEPGQYRLSARAGASLGEAPEAVTVGVGPVERTIEIALERGAVVSGRATDARGQPLADVRLRLIRQRTWNADASQYVRSSAEGHYRFAAVRPGPLTLLAESADHAPASRDLTISSGDLDGIDVVLEDGASVTGLVVDASGAPVAGAVVWTHVQQPDHAPIMKRSGLGSRTDGSGRFRIRGLAAGTVRLNASHIDRGSAEPTSFPLTRGQNKEVRLRLGFSGSIEGVVRRDDGKPAAGVRVVAAWQEGNTFHAVHASAAADGSFRVAPLPAATVRLVATPRRSGDLVVGQGLANQGVFDLREGESRTGAVLVLPSASLAVRGRVRGPDGSPLEGARISAAPEMGMGTGSEWLLLTGDRAEVRSDVDGRFALPELDPGLHTVTVSYAGFPSKTLKAISAGTQDLQVQLEAGGTNFRANTFAR